MATFSNSLCRRSTDLKSQGPEYLMFPDLLYKLFWSSCHECLTEGMTGRKFYIILCEKFLLTQVHTVFKRVTHRPVALCMRTCICVHPIPKHFYSCMYFVVIIKPKSYVYGDHYWSSQNKAACLSEEISCPSGKHSGLQSSAAWGCVFTRDLNTSPCLFKISREKLHVACTSVCFIPFPHGLLNKTSFC